MSIYHCGPNAKLTIYSLSDYWTLFKNHLEIPAAASSDHENDTKSYQ